ncbi:MAG: hypothetical protein RIS43_349 [Actinomycetota bacterium]|jgi:hypothetical protein
MGRGRQKAKQAKVARELKYSTGGTDLEALAAELHSERGTDSAVDDDRYADFEEAEDVEDDDVR